MKLYLGGQTNFGNRGCEALVRGIARVIKARIPDAEILCPLANILQDSRQWPGAANAGVSFVSAPRFPNSLRWWSRFNRVLPLESAGIPTFELDEATRSNLSGCAAVIMTGGDNLTLDYGVPSLYFWTRVNEQAMDMCIPAVLWGASIGPFTQKPSVEKIMVRHLQRYAAITVRETVTLAYLERLGLTNVELVADPAFRLEPEACDALSGSLRAQGPLLGFNVSPLIRKFRQSKSDAALMDREIETFLAGVLNTTDLSVALIPHVDPLDGTQENSDWHYMNGIFRRLERFGERIELAPPNLNAAQLKYLIGQCRFFMGARTHSTIAALSQGVPTISIAYSTKAKGLNDDLFGHLRYVLETPLVDQHTLASGLKTLQAEEAAIKAVLAEKLPEWRSRAGKTADVLCRVIGQEQPVAA